MNIPAKFHGDPITRSGVKRFQSWPSHTRKRAEKKALKVFDTYKECMHLAVFQFLFLHLPLGFFHPVFQFLFLHLPLGFFHSVFTEMILMASSQRLRKKTQNGHFGYFSPTILP